MGADYGAFAESLEHPAASGLRINPHKVTAEALFARLDLDWQPVAWCPTGYHLQPGERSSGDISLGKHPYHAAGSYYLHEPSAMAAVEILDPQPGERVLDLAAAPGGKATQIASKMGSTGLLVANDIHLKRVWELAENLERWGARNTVILNESPERLAERFPNYFHRILLDAPCSGEGMFRKSENARREWSPELVRSCAIRQAAILEQAARMLLPGGTIVYSTCTFAPEENEALIAGFLLAHPEFEITPVEPKPGFSPGRPQWAGKTNPRIAAQIENTVRIWPHLSPGDGHFLAVLVHRGLTRADRHSPAFKSNLPSSYRRAFDEFCSLVLVGDPGFGNLTLEGAYLYHLPEQLPDLSGLRTIHPGLWLGSFKTGAKAPAVRFAPAHALALAIHNDQARNRIDLSIEQAVRYLKGEVLAHPGGDGWLIASLDGAALGWGKRVTNRVKNYYPKGLRWV